MRWVLDNEEYDTEKAEVLAHEAVRSQYEELSSALYKTASGEYFVVEDLEEGGSEIRVLTHPDALVVYLGMAVHLVDEEQAFSGTPWIRRKWPARRLGRLPARSG